MSSFLPDAPARAPGWPEPLPEPLSPSSITTFLVCPEQWRRAYLQGEFSRTSGALVIGGAESTAAEHNFLQKRETYEDMALADVEYRAAEAFDHTVSNDDVQWEDKPGEKNPGEAKDMLIEVVRAAHADEYPLVLEPTLVEAEAVLRIEGLPVVRAYVDVAEPGRVISRKTASAKSMAGTKAAPSRSWLLQSAIESAALEIPTTWHVVTKDPKGPRLLAGDSNPVFTAFDDPAEATDLAVTMVSIAARGMRAMLNEFGPDSYWPTTAAAHFAAKGEGGMTACGFCNFRSSCPAWR